MTTYAGVTPDLLRRLGLDPATDGPLIEWQSLDLEASTPDPVSLVLVGHTTIVGPTTEVALPAGTEEGHLLCLAMTAYGGTTMPTTSDARLTVSETGSTDGMPGIAPWGRFWAGFGVADASGDPLAVNNGPGLADVVTILAVFEVIGEGFPHLWTGIRDAVADGNAYTPAIPAGDAGVAILVGQSGIVSNQFSNDTTGNWITVDQEAGGGSSKGEALIAYMPALLESGTWGGLSNPSAWGALMVGVTAADPDLSLAWVTDPDRSHALISVNPTRGRNDVRGKTRPASITVVAASELADPPEIGDLFRITVCEPAAVELGLTEEEAARFTGEVTDVQLDPANRTWTAIGVSRRARQGRHALNLTGRPSETAHDRVATILDAVTADTGTLDPDPAIVAAPDQVAAATALLDVVSDSTMGQVADLRSGRLDWHGPEHRRGLTPALTLSADEIDSHITWAKRVGSLVNVATINYHGGAVTVTDHASVSRYGEYPVTITTALTTDEDARGLGSLVVGRFSRPVWDLPTLTVDVVRTIDPANTAAILKLRFGDRVALDGLPASGAVAGDLEAYAEQLTERASRWSWRYDLFVSDPTLSGVSIRWIDVDHALQWEDVDPALRWIDLAGIEDSADLGTPMLDYDLGSAGTTGPYSDTFDGGDATTTGPYAPTLDGGTA